MAFVDAVVLAADVVDAGDNCVVVDGDDVSVVRGAGGWGLAGHDGCRPDIRCAVDALWWVSGSWWVGGCWV